MKIRKTLYYKCAILILFTLFSYVKYSSGRNSYREFYNDYTSKADTQYAILNFKSAIDYELQALDTVEFFKDSAKIANSLHRLGRFYAGWDKYTIAIDYYFKAKDYRVALNDSLWLAHELNDIGYAYLYWEDYEQVIDYYNRALKIYTALNNKQEIALAEANIGFAYCFWGQQEEAINHHCRAFDIYSQLKDSSNFSKMYHGLGDAERRRGNTKKAFEYLHKALEYSVECNNEVQKGTNLLRLAQTCTSVRDYKRAEHFFSKCLPFIIKRKSGKWMKNYYQARFEFFESQRKYEKALNAFQRFKAIEDSLFNQRLQGEILEMQIRNKTQEKERNILLLKTENKIVKHEISEQRKIILGTFSALVIILTLLILLYKKNKSRKEAYIKLIEKNGLLINREAEYKQQLCSIKKKDKRSNTNCPLIDKEERERILERLNKMMDEKKLFLKPDLKLGDVCKKLKTNSTYLSYIINQEFGKNFNSYLNDFRVREAQKYIINGEHRILNLEGIALNVGFKNRVTFSTAFKKITGVPPSIYIELINKKS